MRQSGKRFSFCDPATDALSSAALTGAAGSLLQFQLWSSRLKPSVYCVHLLFLFFRIPANNRASGALNGNVKAQRRRALGVVPIWMRAAKFKPLAML